MKCPSCINGVELIEITFDNGEGEVVGKKYRCPQCSRFTPLMPPESTMKDGYKVLKEAEEW